MFGLHGHSYFSHAAYAPRDVRKTSHPTGRFRWCSSAHLSQYLSPQTVSCRGAVSPWFTSGRPPSFQHSMSAAGRINQVTSYSMSYAMSYTTSYTTSYIFSDIISRLCNGGGGRLWTGYACPTLSQVVDHSFLVRTPFCVTASPFHNTCNTPCRSHPDILFTAVSTPFSVQSASAAPS